MANLVSDLIKQAYNALGVTATTTENISADMLADAFRLLNQLWSSWSTEQTMALPARIMGLALAAGSIEYSFGPGLQWNTTGVSGATGYPLRITGWGARYAGAFRGGGIPLDYASFQAKVKDDIGSSALIPRELAFHQIASLTSFASPLMFVQVWPMPAAAPGLVDLEYMYTFPAFVATTDSLNLPPGYERALVSNLAMELAPVYARIGGPPGGLQQLAIDAKVSIMSMNAAILGMNQQQAPAA